MFLHALVLNISAIITAASYPLVVRLYRLFEYICTFKLLHEDFIHSVWNNIYIFVAVIVLFAIAIKLISAMVNPDLLTDSKKGAKSYYFRAVAAVILIFLVPIVFEKSFEIQEELLTKNMLSSHVFGYKVEEGTNLGQILAWEGFSAFCLPDKASQDKIDSRYLSIRADMDNINSVMNEIRLQKSAKYALPTLIVLNDNQWEYHSILCPLVGLLLVYEMVLLCMDTLFRAAKLAFLQIMTPIVLGAFVFDPSILKKWAKEFFSTYISLFLKVLAMYFIAITISQIQAEIAKTDFYNGDWLLTGLFKILLIIALLQLAKKIPDLINKIFGLEIKLRGGIKGRLGEMAGIGGIAQKAWTSLGTGLKNVGKFALTAPIAGAGYGLLAGANSAYKRKTGKELTETKGFKGIKAAGAGLGSIWKTGSISKTVGSATEAYKKPTNLNPFVDKASLATRTDQDIDSVVNVVDNNGNIKNVSTSLDINNKNNAVDTFNSKVSQLAGARTNAANDDYQRKVQATSLAKSIVGDNKGIREIMTGAAARFTKEEDSGKRQAILDALESYEASGSTAILSKFIQDNHLIFTEAAYKNLVGDNGKVRSKERKIQYAINNQDYLGLNQDDITNIQKGTATVTFLAENTLNSREEAAKKHLDITISSEGYSENDQMVINKYIDAAKGVNESKAFAIGRTNTDNGTNAPDVLTDINTNYETLTVQRAQELRAKRLSGQTLTNEEKQELKDLTDIIRRMQRERHNN